jgi:hypothetical protein
MAAEQLDHRRHAIQVVSMLPNELEDALLVLRAAERLVGGFLIEPEPARAAQIVSLVRDCQDRSA